MLKGKTQQEKIDLKKTLSKFWAVASMDDDTKVYDILLESQLATASNQEANARKREEQLQRELEEYKQKQKEFIEKAVSTMNNENEELKQRLQKQSLPVGAQKQIKQTIPQSNQYQVSSVSSNASKLAAMDEILNQEAMDPEVDAVKKSYFNAWVETATQYDTPISIEEILNHTNKFMRIFESNKHGDPMNMTTYDMGINHLKGTSFGFNYTL